MERLKRTRDHHAPIVGAKAQADHLNRAFKAAQARIKNAIARVDPDDLGGRVHRAEQAHRACASTAGVVNAADRRMPKL